MCGPSRTVNALQVGRVNGDGAPRLRTREDDDGGMKQEGSFLCPLFLHDDGSRLAHCTGNFFTGVKRTQEAGNRPGQMDQIRAFHVVYFQFNLVFLVFWGKKRPAAMDQIHALLIPL